MQKSLQKRIRTTKAQRDTIPLLKCRIAALGYYVFPVAPWYRKHTLDFLAIEKYRMRMLMVVRPMRNGTVVIRTNAYPATCLSLRNQLLAIKAPCEIRWSNVQIRSTKLTEEWKEFLPVRERKVIYLLQRCA